MAVDLPERLPDMAASSVDTWKSLSASSTCAAVANGSNLILAKDSEILIIASSCLKGIKITVFLIKDWSHNYFMVVFQS